jgi:hypothetical protein
MTNAQPTPTGSCAATSGGLLTPNEPSCPTPFTQGPLLTKACVLLSNTTAAAQHLDTNVDLIISGMDR